MTTVYEFAGGEPAFQALAAAHHQRCLEDEVLNHPEAKKYYFGEGPTLGQVA